MQKPMLIFGISLISAVAEARFQANNLFPNEASKSPQNCVNIEGLWDGECSEGKETRNARLQIFQDNCTHLALFDFENSLPEVYQIHREANQISSKLSDGFANLTRLSSWSSDGKSFTTSLIYTAEYTEDGKSTVTEGKRDIAISLDNDFLRIKSTEESSKNSGTGKVKEKDVSSCEYKRR